jgi:hypothetical protein
VAPAVQRHPSRRGVVVLATLAAAAACAAWLLVPGVPRANSGRAPPDPWLQERARALVESVPRAETPRGMRRGVWLPEPGVAAAFRDPHLAMEDAYPATLDPATGAIYVPAQAGLTRLVPNSWRRTTIVFDARLPAPLGAVGLAFDPRRHRLMMLSATAGGMTVYLYTPGTGRWEAPVTLRGDEPDSLAYSPADDCFYALSRTQVARSEVYAITRIDAETGPPRWRIPVRERMGGRYDFSIGMMSWGKAQPQLAAVGSFLVIVTPSRYDTQKFVVIDPASGETIYTGPVPSPSPAGRTQ